MIFYCFSVLIMQLAKLCLILFISKFSEAKRKSKKNDRMGEAVLSILSFAYTSYLAVASMSKR